MKPLGLDVADLARDDAMRLASWIARDNMDAALRFLDGLDATYAALAEEPGIGSLYECEMRLLDGLRKKAVQGFPNHLIFYRPEGRRLHILRVLDGRRDLPRVIAWEVHDAPLDEEQD